MSTQELLIAINQLPPAERLALLEDVARSLREEVSWQKSAGASGSETGADVKQDAAPSSLLELRGIFKTQGDPPTDEEIKEDYTRYLMEKYS